MTRPTWDQLREWTNNPRIVVAPTERSYRIGPALRDQGMARASAAEDPEWKRQAQVTIEALARTGKEFTAEDLRNIEGDPFRPNSLGALFSAAAKRGVIVACGYRTAKRGPRHASRILVWIGVK